MVNLHKRIKDYHVYFISSFNLLIRRCWCWINDIWILFLVWIFSISRLFQSWLGHDYLTFQPDNRAFSVIWDIFIPRARTGTLLLCIRHLHPHESLHHDANGHPDNICTVCPLFHVRCVSLSSGQRKPITGDNSAARATRWLGTLSHRKIFSTSSDLHFRGTFYTFLNFYFGKWGGVSG